MQLVAPDALADAVFAARPASWAIVPFDQLDARLKVLTVDGVSLLHRNGNNDYWLNIRVMLPPPKRGAELVQPFLKSEPLTNRDESRMTILAMTGVTALARDTAWMMEQEGVLYPDQKIKSWLTTADIVHLSNEVSFNSDCPKPEPNTSTMAFCSAPKYFDLFKDVHARVIENTGNHINDYGWQPFSYTLSLYDQAGMVYFGGGRTITEAQRAITITDHGNVLGFVGCNPVGPPIAWADGLDDGRPGSAPCRSPYPAMQAELQQLKAAGIVSVATLQYDEQPLGEYSYDTAPTQVADFRRLADAGANIVSGSQAHFPQGFDLYRGGFIHYGVGNLFFDQMQSPGVRQMFVDRYVIYKGRVLSVELLTGIRDDPAQPRPMTADERRAFLQTIFKASGW
jgi:poly-gamma-glutamate synthesis protein (capsule biosynthesis protein)